ncbi:hypothetical protein U27_02588 [Candidatus Vecturithrix granuli]|uniref:Uncharacterized protein n=1 Tax=Vecturithrix granuli TaxID=1499967 RepID=A0A081CB04_VECG1|nr:hypothetical protein U27_02588 [Candidatus Vecturithrix granuli]
MSAGKILEFNPIRDKNGRRRFDRELEMLLRTKSRHYRELQIIWQNDPDVLQWCATHQEHWTRLVKQFGYNNEARRSSRLVHSHSKN